MEYINGVRIDDKEYLAKENIDRNMVALELARIFSRMVHLNGWFHAVCPSPMIQRGSVAQYLLLGSASG